MANNLQIVWDLSSLAGSDNDPLLEQRLRSSTQSVKAFCDRWRNDPSYLDKPEVLKQALDDYELLEREHGCNGWQSYYFSLRQAQDQTNTDIRTKSRLADEKAIELYNQIQFFSLSLTTIKPDKQQLFLDSPALKDYRYFLAKIFAEQAFVLSEPEEKILNLVSQPAARSWVDMTETFLAGATRQSLSADKELESLNLPQLLSLTNHRDKEIRDQAADRVNEINVEYAAVATEEMNALLSYKKIVDELRGFERPDAARHLSDGVDSSMVDVLLESVSNRNNLANEYYLLKAKLMGQPTLAYHERNVEYGKIEGNYAYQESLDLVGRVFNALDGEFGQIVDSFVRQGQIDVFPRQGKSGGAFCAHNLPSQPTYILLNHTDRLQDVLTMAHEFGHGINNELSRHKQNAINFGTSLATAEVASTFMEDFVLEELLRQADDQTRLAIMMMKLNDDMSSIFRQVACYRFEQALHATYRQQGYLSTEAIGELFETYMAEYMGPAVDQPATARNWWVYWSHIRNSFYVYSYASGLLISKSLQAMVHQNPAAITQVKQFLAAGTSASPSEIFASIGIDINQASFWDAGLTQIEQLLAQSKDLASRMKLL